MALLDISVEVSFIVTSRSVAMGLVYGTLFPSPIVIGPLPRSMKRNYDGARLPPSAVFMYIVDLDVGKKRHQQHQVRFCLISTVSRGSPHLPGTLGKR